MTSTGSKSEALDLVERTKLLWPRKALTADQAVLWWERLKKFGITSVLQALDDFYALDLESAKPANEPRYREIRDIAYRLSRADWERRRIGAENHPANEHPEIRTIRFWWESWRRDRNIGMPDWAQEILDEHDTRGVALRVWQSWSKLDQEVGWCLHYVLPWIERDVARRMQGDQVQVPTPTLPRPSNVAVAFRLPRIHRALLELPTVGYRTQATRDQWIDRIEYAASECGVQLEGAIKNYTPDEVPF